MEFDATPMSPTANSYMDVNTADTFADGKLKNESWTSLTDRQKKQVLIEATTRLDMERYGGVQSTSISTITPQRLQWPRAQLPFNIDSTIIPVQLQHATIEMAFNIIAEANDDPSVSRQDMDRLTSMSVGPLIYGIQVRAEGELPDMVKRLLSSLGEGVWLGELLNSNLKIIR